MIGGMRGSRAVEALLAGFENGVRMALPTATVLRDSDQSYLGDHVLVSTVKRYDQAVFMPSAHSHRALSGAGRSGSASATRRWGSSASVRASPNTLADRWRISRGR